MFYTAINVCVLEVLRNLTCIVKRALIVIIMRLIRCDVRKTLVSNDIFGTGRG